MVFMNKPIVLKKGTSISCPNCDNEITKTIIDIHQGDKLVTSAFEYREWIISGTLMLSPCCGVGFAKCVIYTSEHGWI